MKTLVNRLNVSRAFLFIALAGTLGVIVTAALLVGNRPALGTIGALLTIVLLALILAHSQATAYRRQEKRARTWGVRHSVSQQELSRALKAHRHAIIRANDAALAETIQEIAALNSAVQDLQILIAQTHRAEQRAAREDQQRRRQLLFHEIFQDAM